MGGVLVRNVLPLPAPRGERQRDWPAGIIPLTIVLTGAGLNLVRVASVGSTALLITVVCIAVSMVATDLAGAGAGRVSIARAC